VLADGAVRVVLFAVHVRGDHAAQRHELRAWRDGHEDVAREEEAVEREQRAAGLRAKDHRARVEGEEAVGERGVDDRAVGARRQGAVAVAAPEAAREGRADRRALEIVGAQLAAARAEAAPAADRARRRDAPLALHRAGRVGRLGAHEGLHEGGVLLTRPKRKETGGDGGPPGASRRGSGASRAVSRGRGRRG
jgi:hypothetical protein